MDERKHRIIQCDETHNTNYSATFLSHTDYIISQKNGHLQIKNTKNYMYTYENSYVLLLGGHFKGIQGGQHVNSKEVLICTWVSEKHVKYFINFVFCYICCIKKEISFIFKREGNLVIVIILMKLKVNRPCKIN